MWISSYGSFLFVCGVPLPFAAERCAIMFGVWGVGPFQGNPHEAFFVASTPEVK